MAANNTAKSIQSALIAGSETASELSTFLNPYALASVRNQQTALDVNSITAIASGMAITNSGIDINSITNLIDCARNIEDRILLKLQEKLIQQLLANPTASQIIGIASAATAFVSSMSQLIDIVKKVDPEDFLTSLLIAKSLQGFARAEKVNEILRKFGNSVNNIVDIIENLDVLDICSIPNVSASGIPIGIPSNIPSGPPAERISYDAPATINTEVIDAKDQYDSLMLEIKDHTRKNPDMSSEMGYDSMITSINTIAMGYHHKVLRSNSVTDDPGLYDQYKKSVEVEANIHSSKWSDTTKADYTRRAEAIGTLIQQNTIHIRNYAMRTNRGPVLGTLLLTGITWYSTPDKDYTTYLDLRESERPPELTEYWKSKGKNTNKKGGSLLLSWTTKGSKGDSLIPDVTCASTRVPLDSVLALKKPDGTPYDPTGKNPTGLVRVLDTGSNPETYNKVDVYTQNPELYKDMSSVQVYLVSLGNRVTKQYIQAQKLYGQSTV